jgi:hypothetical protein
MKRQSVLRWNRLRKRADSLGVNVQTLIKIDAAAQRELQRPVTRTVQRR